VLARASLGERFSLVVLDGNWTETSEMSRGGTLDCIQAFALDVGKYLGLFSQRRPKQDGFLSTLEAIAYVPAHCITTVFVYLIPVLQLRAGRD